MTNKIKIKNGNNNEITNAHTTQTKTMKRIHNI